MVKYKCIKIECPVCGNSGSLQLFLNKSNNITYARVRHYMGKGKFIYCKTDLQALKTLLNGQDGQDQTSNNIDLNQNNGDQNLKVNSFNLETGNIQEGRSSSLVRTLALRAKGRRFKSGSAHHLPFLLVESELFAELHVENCIIKCFKWFSKVLLRLNPRDFDFSTSSLSKYNTTFLFVVIAFASARKRMDILGYMFGHLSQILTKNKKPSILRE
jgi:hypothetical protein